ncbi:MAG TPA: AraC family transcriptional regulator [Kofleriaceae bacterium]|jgi:AraC family transcriptional regulator|nr:AraC family transcriptional regulator [Kofleriaceae bacterium]
MPLSSLHDLPMSNVPKHVDAHCPASVVGLPLTVMSIPAHGEFDDDRHEVACIFVAHQGHGRRWYRQGRVIKSLHTAPRMIEIYERGARFDHQRWEGVLGRCAQVEFHDADVQAMTHGQLSSLELRTRHEVFDDRVSRLTLELAEEALCGMPNGELYVQGLCVALLGALANRHGAGGELRSPGGTLGAAQQRRLSDLIQHQLGARLSLNRLAHEVGLSPHHFARLFKATYGTTPHQYVQALRLDAAAAALRRDPAVPIAEVALACGFASQSHMTELMRRRLGVTPRALRRDGAARSR